MSVVRDHLWIWGHTAGGHNEGWDLPAPSRITAVEAAHYLGVPNLIMVNYGGLPAPPFDQEAIAQQSLERVVWSIVGDSSSKRNDEKSDLDEVLDLATKFPNVTGAIMDDFFHGGAKTGEEAGRYSADDLQTFQSRLHASNLDLWVVLYTHQLDLPFERHMDYCDVVTLWTWNSPDLENLEANFACIEARAPDTRKVLGCYMWDYGPHGVMSVEAMQMQCELGLEWLKEGRIEGMIFLSNCVCDIGLEAVEWSREWIRRVGHTVV